jgi:glucose-6-phosphate isomerase
MAASGLIQSPSVSHIALRAPKDKVFNVDETNVVPQVHVVLNKIAAFTEKVRSGEWVGATGKKLSAVVSIGIGGSCEISYGGKS